MPLTPTQKKTLIHQFLQSPLLPIPTLSQRISRSLNLPPKLIEIYLNSVTETKMFGRVLKKNVLADLEREQRRNEQRGKNDNSEDWEESTTDHSSTSSNVYDHSTKYNEYQYIDSTTKYNETVNDYNSYTNLERIEITPDHDLIKSSKLQIPLKKKKKKQDSTSRKIETAKRINNLEKYIKNRQQITETDYIHMNSTSLNYLQPRLETKSCTEMKTLYQNEIASNQAINRRHNGNNPRKDKTPLFSVEYSKLNEKETRPLPNYLMATTQPRPQPPKPSRIEKINNLLNHCPSFTFKNVSKGLMVEYLVVYDFFCKFRGVLGMDTIEDGSSSMPVPQQSGHSGLKQNNQSGLNPLGQSEHPELKQSEQSELKQYNQSELKQDKQSELNQPKKSRPNQPKESEPNQDRTNDVTKQNQGSPLNNSSTDQSYTSQSMINDTFNKLKIPEYDKFSSSFFSDSNFYDLLKNIEPYSNKGHITNTHLTMEYFHILLNVAFSTLFEKIFFLLQSERKREKITIVMDMVDEAMNIFWGGHCDFKISDIEPGQEGLDMQNISGTLKNEQEKERKRIEGESSSFDQGTNVHREKRQKNKMQMSGTIGDGFKEGYSSKNAINDITTIENFNTKQIDHEGIGGDNSPNFARANYILLSSHSRTNWPTSRPTFSSLLSFLLDIKRLLRRTVPDTIDLRVIQREMGRKKGLNEFNMVEVHGSEKEDISNDSKQTNSKNKHVEKSVEQSSKKPKLTQNSKKSGSKQKDDQTDQENESNSSKIVQENEDINEKTPHVSADPEEERNLTAKIKLLKFLIDILYESNTLRISTADWNKETEDDCTILREFIKNLRAEMRRVKSLEISKNKEGENDKKYNKKEGDKYNEEGPHASPMKKSSQINNLKELPKLPDKICDLEYLLNKSLAILEALQNLLKENNLGCEIHQQEQWVFLYVDRRILAYSTPSCEEIVGGMKHLDISNKDGMSVRDKSAHSASVEQVVTNKTHQKNNSTAAYYNKAHFCLIDDETKRMLGTIGGFNMAEAFKFCTTSR